MSEWTISTLKVHLETIIKALKRKCEDADKLLASEARNAAEALVKQASEYERRLTDLNHEAARINAANAKNVGREVYDADKKANDEWKHRIEGLVNAAVPKSDFHQFKEEATSALQLRAGNIEGVGRTGRAALAIILGAAGVAGIIFGLVTLLAKSGGT